MSASRDDDDDESIGWRACARGLGPCVRKIIKEAEAEVPQGYFELLRKYFNRDEDRYEDNSVADALAILDDLCHRTGEEYPEWVTDTCYISYALDLFDKKKNFRFPCLAQMYVDDLTAPYLIQLDNEHPERIFDWDRVSAYDYLVFVEALPGLREAVEQFWEVRDDQEAAQAARERIDLLVAQSLAKQAGYAYGNLDIKSASKT